MKKVQKKPTKKALFTADQVCQIRKELDATLEQASMLLQVSFVTWCHWEHGTSIDPLHAALLILLHKALRKAGRQAVFEALKTAAIRSNRVEMLQALVKLSA